MRKKNALLNIQHVLDVKLTRQFPGTHMANKLLTIHFNIIASSFRQSLWHTPVIQEVGAEGSYML